MVLSMIGGERGHLGKWLRDLPVQGSVPVGDRSRVGPCTRSASSRIRDETLEDREYRCR